LNDFESTLPGSTNDKEQQLNAQSTENPENEIDEAGFFERLGAKTESLLEDFFTVLGTYCANNPWKVLLAGE
jgi:Niemann-Pick C1 protein